MTKWNRHSKRITRGPRWKALRMAILERDGFVCVACGARGRLEVDHIQSVRLRPDLAYAPANLQALCTVCHSKKTNAEMGRKPASKDRLQWRRAVIDLMATTKSNEHTEGNPNA